MKIILDGIHTNLRFSSAHMIIGHDACGKIHGHSYILDLEIEGEPTGEYGFVIDFKIIKEIARKICKSLDHRLIIPYNHPEIEVIEENDEIFHFKTQDKKEYLVPQEDIVILPIKSTNAESIAVYITEKIMDELLEYNNLKYIEIQVNEGIGQGAAYKKYF